MQQRVQFESSRYDSDGRAVFCPGDTIQATVTLVADQDVHARGVQIWCGCQVHGSGTAETVDLVPEHFCMEGDVQAGQPIVGRVEATLPTDAPVSYQGRRVKFDWCIRMRVDIPIWRDQRIEFPFLVMPRGQ